MKEDVTSSTALTVLQGILYTAKKEKFKHLVSKQMQEACTNILNSSLEGQKRLKQLDSKLFVLAVPLVEKLLVPGLTLHYILRKSYIESFVVESIKNGFTQIVNLGAGFDTLAFRLSKTFPKVSFIEIDHPATQNIKEKALKEKSDNLHLLPVDFSRQNLKDELSAFSDFDKNKATIFISEGVLMYLDIEDVKKLFHSLKELTNSQMKFIFTFIEPMSQNKDSYGILLKFYLQIKKEHLYWDIKKTDIPTFLTSLGYEQEVLADADTFKELFLPNTTATLHRGEAIVVAK